MDLTEARTKWKLLRSAQMWPIQSRLDPEAWLRNFRESELPHAIALLDSYMYLSSDACQRLFVHAIRKLSQIEVFPKTSAPIARKSWERFLSSLIVVRVTGEDPSDADSGYIFVRYARDLLKLDEDQILSPEQAISALMQDPPRTVVFVDDFAGSGNQFDATWYRTHPLGGGIQMSFNDIAEQCPDTAFYYCPLVCTWKAIERLSGRCPGVQIVPAHFLSRKYSALDSDSILWPDGLRSTSTEFLLEASLRAGHGECGGEVGDWRGYRKLALAISFEHGTPDATLPIFTSTLNDWVPLVRTT